MQLETVEPRWTSCIVAAPGPSLDALTAQRCRDTGLPTIVVQDAWRMLPWAEVLYGADSQWWSHHNGVPCFAGDRWSAHDDDTGTNDKGDVQRRYNVRCVRGSHGVGFSLDPSVIHYGSNSGFQAINLAILLGCTRIRLCGFDMRRVDGRAHFFGEHPDELGHATVYESFIREFDVAAKLLPSNLEIVNCTPGSALRCFPMGTLDDALHELARGEGLRGSRCWRSTMR